MRVLVSNHEKFNHETPFQFNLKENNMIIENGTCLLGNATSISPIYSKHFMEFGEKSGLRVMIPTKTILRLYSIMQSEVESRGQNFDEWCSDVMKTEDK